MESGIRHSVMLWKQQTWEICYVGVKDTIIECGVSIWQECLLNWILTRITKDLLKEQIVIPCPNNACSHYISLEDMNKSLNKENFEIVLDKFWDVYICNQNDMRKWPNAEWINAGIIEL